MPAVTGERTGWQAWTPAQAAEAKLRYEARRLRLAREARENDERLAAKAQAKLADLENQTLLKQTPRPFRASAR